MKNKPRRYKRFKDLAEAFGAWMYDIFDWPDCKCAYCKSLHKEWKNLR
jgi:hypothetical protein